MCEIVTAAEDSYFEHVCNYSMSAMVNGCHVSKQTLAPILNIQPSHLVTVLQPGVTSCIDRDYIIKGGGGGSSSSTARCVRLAAYCRVYRVGSNRLKGLNTTTKFTTFVQWLKGFFPTSTSHILIFLQLPSPFPSACTATDLTICSMACGGGGNICTHSLSSSSSC